MAVDGDDSDWIANTPLNPSDDAMPGKVSGDGSNDFYVTYSEGDALYIGMTGEDLTNNDLLIYLDVVAGGSNTGYNLNGAHTLPMQADYLFWATDETNMASSPMDSLDGVRVLCQLTQFRLTWEPQRLVSLKSLSHSAESEELLML